MKAEPRLPDFPIKTAAPPPRGRLEDVLERLAMTGYRVDREKWKRFEKAGILATPLPTDRGVREAIRRLRRILDVERRLAPTGNIDALCFHLVAAGIDSIPGAAVTRYVIASLTELFALGDRLKTGMPSNGTLVGPDGEFRLGREMAKRTLSSYRVRDRAERRSLESLMSAAFVGFVRSTYVNPRPAQILHASSRLVTLDSVDGSAKTKRACHTLPPLAERSGLFGWLSELTAENETAIVRATQSVAAFIRLHVHCYPELQLPWRDVAGECTPSATQALRALTLVPPVLAAAYLQAGGAPADPDLDRMLERLMHYWGTVSFESVRFELSNGTFPWVRRA